MTEFAIGFVEALAWFVLYVPFLVYKSAFALKLD